MWLQLLTSNWHIPKSWECNFSFPFLFPKFGNGLSYSCSCSQSSISYSRSPLAPGGTIEQLRDAIVHNLMDMETLADAMTVKKNWDRPQYAILKEMCLDLKRMHYSFRVNRSWSPKNKNLISFCSGTRPLASSGQCPRWKTAPSSLPRGATGGTSPTPRRSLRRRQGRKTKTTRRRGHDWSGCSTLTFVFAVICVYP